MLKASQKKESYASTFASDRIEMLHLNFQHQANLSEYGLKSIEKIIG